MVVGVGIDLIEIARLERALERRPRLLERLFTAGECRYANERARPGQHLAARFAAKEAVAKALGLDGWSFRDVEVIAGPPPVACLSGRAGRRAAEMEVEIHISLTHARGMAGAVALATPPTP